MKRRFHLKRKYPVVRYMIVAIIGVILYGLISSKNFQQQFMNSNASIVEFLIQDSNPYVERDLKQQVRTITSFFSQIDFNHPVSILERQIEVTVKEPNK